MIKSIFLMVFISVSSAQNLQVNKQGPEGEKLSKGAFSESKSCTSREVIDLYQPGQSLYGVPQQDQDGLNTCYANTASLMLKSINPELPVPSYLDIASYNTNITKSYYDFDWGVACDVVNNIYKDQKVAQLCSHGTFEEGHYQSDLLYPLYNGFNEEKSFDIEGLKTLISNELQDKPFPQSMNKCTQQIISDDLHSYLQTVFKLADFKSEESRKKCEAQLKTNIRGISWRLLLKFRELGLEDKVINLMKRYDYFNYKNKIINWDEVLSLNNSLRSPTEELNKELFKILTEYNCPIGSLIENTDPPLTETLKNDFLLSSLYDSCYKPYIDWRDEVNSCGEEPFYYEFYEMIKDLNGVIKNMESLREKDNRSLLGKIIDLNCPKKYPYNLKKMECQSLNTKSLSYDETVNKVYSSLKDQRAVGVSTCSSIFSHEEKKNYSDCRNHEVTITGMKCGDDLRPKVLVSNSWGIDCNDNGFTYHLLRCERDANGITTGRAWVDMEYLIHPKESMLHLFSE